MADWTYGDSWERHPIAPGEIWSDGKGSAVSVHDLRAGAPAFMIGVELIYTDPPWTQGNVNSFVTKAGLDSRVSSFAEFMDPLFAAVAEIRPQVCFLEVGQKHMEDFRVRLGSLFPSVQVWPITYYRKNSCYLLRGGMSQSAKDYTGMDDERTPAEAISAERPASVGDICMGRGLTMLSAHRAGARFVGAELNQRRLAVAIDRAAKIGVEYRLGRAS